MKSKKPKKAGLTGEVVCSAEDWPGEPHGSRAQQQRRSWAEYFWKEREAVCTMQAVPSMGTKAQEFYRVVATSLTGLWRKRNLR